MACGANDNRQPETIDSRMIPDTHAGGITAIRDSLPTHGSKFCVAEDLREYSLVAVQGPSSIFTRTISREMNAVDCHLHRSALPMR